MINITLSLVIYKSKTQDLKNLFSSYSKSLNHAATEQPVHSLIYIINNNSDDDCEEIIKSMCEENDLDFIYIQSPKNGGYGYGHNQAVKLLNSDYHIICNPDIVFHDDTIINALDFMKHNKDFSLLTPAVFGIDGERHYLCKKNPTLFHLFLRRFVPNKIKYVLFKKYLDHFEYRDQSYNEVIFNIPFCTGCFMFFRTEKLKWLKGFDERFFMYLEDADLSRRSLNIGKTVYLPYVRVTHLWERGAYKNKKLRNMAIKSALIYWKKWGGIF